MLKQTRLAGLSVLVVAGCLLTACGGGSSATDTSTGTGGGGASAAAAGQTATAAATSPSGSTSQVSIRIANLYVTADSQGANSQAGPGLDVYDVALTGQPAKPILTDVPYGSFSAYVHPHLTANSVTKMVELTVLPTGEDPVAKMLDAKGIGGILDDGSHPQATLLLADDEGGARQSDPLDSLSFSIFVEKGNDSNGAGKGPVAPVPPAGQGELVTSTAVMDDQRIHGVGWYLMIDDSCDEPLNHDPNSTGVPEIFAATSAAFTTGFALFPVAAGTHQVSVVSWSDSTAPTCAQLTAKQGQLSVDATADQQSLVFLYGTSVTDLHLAIGPIQP